MKFKILDHSMSNSQDQICCWNRILMHSAFQPFSHILGLAISQSLTAVNNKLTEITYFFPGCETTSVVKAAVECDCIG